MGYATYRSTLWYLLAPLKSVRRLNRWCAVHVFNNYMLTSVRVVNDYLTYTDSRFCKYICKKENFVDVHMEAQVKFFDQRTKVENLLKLSPKVGVG